MDLFFGIFDFFGDYYETKLIMEVISLLIVMIVSPVFLIKDRVKILNYIPKLKKTKYEKQFPHLKQLVDSVRDIEKASFDKLLSSSVFSHNEVIALKAIWNRSIAREKRIREYKKKTFLAKATYFYFDV